MPYKKGMGKIEVYDREDVLDGIEDLTLALDLKRQPVGIQFLFSKEDYEESIFDEVIGHLSYCMMVEKASRGKGFKSMLCHHNCDGGTTALGLEASTDRIESGLEYYSYNLYKSKSAARRMRSNIKSLHNENSTYGMAVGPLSAFKTAPDVVQLVGNPYQIMRLTQGVVYHSGVKPKLDYAAMQAICSELTTVPYTTGDINISSFCPSTRLLARWKDEEMAMGMPFDSFLTTVEGVMATMDGTDVKKRKKEIMKRFKDKGKTLDINLDGPY